VCRDGFFHPCERWAHRGFFHHVGAYFLFSWFFTPGERWAHRGFFQHLGVFSLIGRCNACSGSVSFAILHGCSYSSRRVLVLVVLIVFFKS